MSRRASRSRRFRHAASCAFCGAVGVTKEHALGRQFADVVPGVGRWVHQTFDPERPQAPPHVKVAGGPAFVARVSCARCNGGWMREIDDRARPLVTSLARGRALALEAEAVTALASWAYKVMLVMMLKEPAHRRFAPPARYRLLQHERQPPGAAQLWAGRTPSGDPLWFRANSVRWPSEGAIGYGATLIVGELVLHMVARPDDRAPALRLSGLSSALTALWPATRCRWPPTQTLPLRGVLDLASIVAYDARFTAPDGPPTAG